jgi:hypothetical protein
MTTYTQTDLATRTLRDLGLIGSEEVPSAADLAWANQTIESVVPTLAAIGLPIWNGSEAQVPSEYLVPLSKRIGLDIASSFGLTDPVEAEAAKTAMERTLTLMANPRRGDPGTLRTDEATGSLRRFNWAAGL